MKCHYSLFIASIKQAAIRNSNWCIVKSTKTNLQLTKLLVTHGFIAFYSNLYYNKLCLYLKFGINKVIIKNIHSISNSGKKVYATNKKIHSLYRNSIVVVATSQGFYISKAVDSFLSGGELLFELEV